MATNFVPRFAAVTLTSGSADATEIRDGSVITDYIMNMTMPEVRVLPKTVPVSGGRAQQTLAGPVEIDEFSMTMHGIYAGILAAWTRDINLTITRELVSYPALGGALQTIEIGGTVMGVKMADMDFQAADGLLGIRSGWRYTTLR